LRSGDFWTRYRTVRALGHAEESAAPHALRLAELAVEDASSLVRHEAARALGALGADACPHAAALAAALGDEEMLVRRDAAKALAAMRPSALEPHVEELVGALGDEFWPVRLWASKALGTCGPAVASGAGLGELSTMALEDDEASVREMAAQALGCLGAEAVPHIQQMAEKLFSSDEDERKRASIALASALSAPELQARSVVASALQPLMWRAEGKTKDGRENGQHRSDPEKKRAVAVLQIALQDEDWQTRLRAIAELRAMVLQ